MERKKASDFDPQLLSLFRQIRPWRHQPPRVFGWRRQIRHRRPDGDGFVGHARAQLRLAQQVAKDDKRIRAEYTMYPSPKGNSSNGTMRGLLARPATGDKFPVVVVIHENRGLNPYIEDVVRRLAVAGFMALGPDAIWPLGGYPSVDKYGAEADEKAAEMQKTARRRENHRRLRRRGRVSAKASTIHRQARCRGLLLSAVVWSTGWRSGCRSLRPGFPFMARRRRSRMCRRSRPLCCLTLPSRIPTSTPDGPNTKPPSRRMASSTRPMCIPKRITAFITIRHRVMTQKRRNSPGNAPSTTSTRR